MTDTPKVTSRARYPMCGKIHAEYRITCGDCGHEEPVDGGSHKAAEMAAMHAGWAKITDPWWRCSACVQKFQNGRAA